MEETQQILRTEHSVMEKTHILSTVFAHSLDGMAFIDADMMIIAVNGSFLRQLHLGKVEVNGLAIETVHPEWAQQMSTVYQHVLMTGKAYQESAYPIYGLMDDERLTYWDISVSPVYDQDEFFLGWLHVQKDVTERIHAQQARDILFQQLREVNEQLATAINDENVKVSVFKEQNTPDITVDLNRTNDNT